MDGITIFAVLISAGLMIYLTIALLKPENFS